MISAGMASPVFFFRPACPSKAPTRLCVMLSMSAFRSPDSYSLEHMEHGP